jgi:uncharacterized membrane protein YeaQ/YmgE (transglycosylase-associated protein family)
MHLFGYLLFGLIVGVAARLLVPGREPGGWLASILIGVFGSLFAGLMGRVLGFYEAGEPAGFVMAVGGAAAILLAYHVLAGRRVSA